MVAIVLSSAITIAIGAAAAFTVCARTGA